MPNRPYFDTIEMKGGGDATSAARAVLQTGEYDYAWNLQVEDEVLKRMEAGGKGKAHIVPAATSSSSSSTSPTRGTRSRASAAASRASTSPSATEGARGDGAALRQEEHAGVHLRPHRLRDRQLHEQPGALPLAEHEVGVQRRQGERAARAAGWKKGADGIREKGGKKMKFVYQTSINGTAQKEQAIVKQAAQKAGIDLELKSVTASVFFSSDVANPDTYGKFWADMQMYTTTMTAPDAERFMDQYISPRSRRRPTSGRPQHLPLRQPRVRQARRRPSRSSIRSSARRRTSR
jgi:peptide/nickel transport system substrate-binding protein